MNGGESGFHNAPVTRSFVIASSLLTIVAGVRGRAASLGLSYQDLFKKFQLWKLITSVFAFSSTPELVFGVYLLYYFRVFERQIGSNKHSVFMLFSVVVSKLLEILALTYLRDPSNNMVSGPYGLIFAAFVPFYFDIPVSSRFRIFGLRFSDKSFMYLAGLQLLFSSWKGSLIPGLCGILAGILYRLNAFGIRKIKFPDAFLSFFSSFSWPFSSNSSSTMSSGNNMGIIHSNPSHQVDVNYPSAAPIPNPDPDENSIGTLVAMGFDRDSSRQALLLSGNNINAASNILINALWEELEQEP